MARKTAGRRYPLVIYTHMLSRWWTAVFTLGLSLLALAWALRSWQFEEWRWRTTASLGVLVVCAGVAILIFRNSAYVQPFTDHLRLVTPFLRVNISYKRFRRATSAAMYSLFPPRSISGWRREILRPLQKMTAIVVELNEYPISHTVLRLFLSPFFFKDRTPHFVILVKDWMTFSAELESRRSGAGDSAVQRSSQDQSILSRLPPNR